MNPVVWVPADGYLTHGDLLGRGREQGIALDDGTAHVSGSEDVDLEPDPDDGPLPQPKRLANSTLYPGGELPDSRLRDV